MDLPIVHNLPEFINNLLPNHYSALDLGSGNGRDSELIEESCSRTGKQGTFIKVDPFITQEGIIKKFMD